LQDILDASENVSEYIGKMSFEEFSADKKTIDAVVRNLEIIGEAVKNLSDEILQTKPEIEWKQIACFRDIVVHRYFKVDLEIVWDILQNRLPDLQQAVKEILTDITEEF
jgi:uncharacterized protein with HEPN domain